jgi:hypothetical protein
MSDRALPSPKSPLLDPSDAATYLKNAESTLARWRVEQRGPAFVMVGRHIKYDVADLDEYLRRNRIKPLDDVYERLSDATRVALQKALPVYAARHQRRSRHFSRSMNPASNSWRWMRSLARLFPDRDIPSDGLAHRGRTAARAPTHGDFPVSGNQR